MGSSMTCKLNPCCGDRLNCEPPAQYQPRYAPAPDPKDARIARLEYVLHEIIGTIDEFEAMPCASLERRMLDTVRRYRSEVGPKP